MLVSVVIITYAHENYIRAALEGILMQKCNFPFEIILSNDASPDNTNELLKNIIESNKTGVRIDYTQHKKNLGMMGNFVWALNKAKGKYIAYCEGDDYWIDPNKLQKQVDFLESNHDFSICFTDYSILEEANQDFKSSQISRVLRSRNVFGLEDIIRNNFIPTLTVMYRNSFAKFPSNFEYLFPGDWPLHILNAQYGKIKFLPIVSAVYRKHNGGVCSSSKPIDNYKRYLNSLVLIQGWFKDADDSIKYAFLVARIKIYLDILKYYVKLKLLNWGK